MISREAVAIANDAVGWSSGRPTPRVSVDLNGQLIGGPTASRKAVDAMKLVWEEMESIAEALPRLDSLIKRQQAWCDKFGVAHPSWDDHFATLHENIEKRNVLWRDRIPELEHRARDIVAQMDPEEVYLLGNVHPYAELGSIGLTARFFELATELDPHPLSWPSCEDIPF